MRDTGEKGLRRREDRRGLVSWRGPGTGGRIHGKLVEPEESGQFSHSNAQCCSSVSQVNLSNVRCKDRRDAEGRTPGLDTRSFPTPLI